MSDRASIPASYDDDLSREPDMPDLTPAQELRAAAEAMRDQHGPEHVRHRFWSAVADWLDRFADPVYCYGPAEYDAALNIARAYLGAGES